MASPAKQVIDNEIRKLLDFYAALEEEKQRHAIATLNAQQTQAIMDWLKKQDDEMANALAQKQPPSKPLKPDEWEYVYKHMSSNAPGYGNAVIPNTVKKHGLNQFMHSPPADQNDVFYRKSNVFRLRQPEGLSAEEAVRQAPIRVFAEQIITDVVEVVASPLSHGFNPSPTMNAEQFADQAIAAAEEASLRKMWKTESKKRIPVVYVSHDVASVIQSGCSETSVITLRYTLEDRDVITPHIIHNPQRYSFAIGTKFAVLEFDVDMNLEDWQARVLFAPDDPKMIMPIIDNNFI